MAPEKTIGTSSTISFADIELDSVLVEARLPPNKLVKCLDLITGFLRRRKVTLREMESLTGLFNFACTVVIPGRGFLWYLVDLTIGIYSPHFLTRLTRDVEDLKVWQQFLSGFNSRSFFFSLLIWLANSHHLKLYLKLYRCIWCHRRWGGFWQTLVLR